MNEAEIRFRLKWLHTIFGLFVLALALCVTALIINRDPLRSWFGILFVTLLCTHAVLAVQLGLLAGKLGKGGLSVGLAAFITTPILAPFSYVRIVLWARQALTNFARGAKACAELGIDDLPKMSPMVRDRL